MPQISDYCRIFCSSDCFGCGIDCDFVGVAAVLLFVVSFSAAEERYRE